MTPSEFQQKVYPLKDRLYRFAKSIVTDKMTAEDVVQEVMIKIWQSSDLSEIRNLEAWAMQLTKNLSIDKTRSKRSETVDLLKVAWKADERATPDRQAETNEQFETVIMMIQNLTEKQQQVIHLRESSGLEYHEIAETLGISIDDVKVNLFRARKQLRDQLIKINAYGLHQN